MTDNGIPVLGSEFTLSADKFVTPWETFDHPIYRVDMWNESRRMAEWRDQLPFRVLSRYLDLNATKELQVRFVHHGPYGSNVLDLSDPGAWVLLANSTTLITFWDGNWFRCERVEKGAAELQTGGAYTVAFRNPDRSFPYGSAVRKAVNER